MRVGACAGLPAPAADPFACPRASPTVRMVAGVQGVLTATRASPPPGFPFSVFSWRFLSLASPRGCVSGVASGMGPLWAGAARETRGFVVGRCSRAGLPET